MTCRHCGQPIQRCDAKRCGFYDCRGHIHARDGQHSCEPEIGVWQSADPDPGTLPDVEAPAGKPEGEVA